MTELEKRVFDLLRLFHRRGGESNSYLRAVVRLRDLVPCDNSEIDNLIRDGDEVYTSGRDAYDRTGE